MPSVTATAMTGTRPWSLEADTTEKRELLGMLILYVFIYVLSLIPESASTGIFKPVKSIYTSLRRCFPSKHTSSSASHSGYVHRPHAVNLNVNEKGTPMTVISATPFTSILTFTSKHLKRVPEVIWPKQSATNTLPCQYQLILFHVIIFYCLNYVN